MTLVFDRDFADRLVDAVNRDPGFRTVSAHFETPFALAFGETRFLFRPRDGRIEEVIQAPTLAHAVEFAIAGETEVWERLFQPVPPPMDHHLLSCIARGRLHFEGNIQRYFQHALSLDRIVHVARGLAGPAPLRPNPERVDLPQAVGRTVHVEVDGRIYPVFYYEAGEGRPLLCQHTAGTENRQWRHLLEDRELTRDYRVIAYDLPGHGKSDLPWDDRYPETDHPLTSDFVTRFVVAFAEALALDQPVFVGCSIGGVIAMHLAARFPDRFRGCIGLAGSIPTGGFPRHWWVHPEINTAWMAASIVDSVVAPDISARDRQLTTTFQTANPRNLRDDLYLWCEDNGKVELADQIDPGRIAVHLMAGEYDYTCPPEDVEACAKRIGGDTRYTLLRGLGHFPMSEDYGRFRPHLLEALEAIETRHA